MTNPIRVATAALSGRIFAGRPTKDGAGFKEPRYDVTSDVLVARIAELEAEVERLRDGLAGAIAAISDPRGLDDAICCSGHMCGCRGSSHRELLLHDLSEVLARTALGASHDA